MAQRKAFLLRIDPALWAAVERLAQAELRSANAQVEYLLRDALSRRGALPGPVAGPFDRPTEEHER
jgi:hypothetical protein